MIRRRWSPEALLLVAALALRLAAFGGPSRADDFAYLEHAKDWVDGCYDPARLAYVNGLRYGIVLPVAGAMALFGPSPAATALAPLAASLLAVVAAMAVGRRLGTRATGLLTGAVVAVTPLPVLSATLVLPEAFTDAALWGSLALALRGAQERRGGALLAAGLAAGYAYTVRSYTAGLGVLAFLPVWRLYRVRPAHALLFFAGVAVCPAAEMLYHLAATGDALWSLHLQARVYRDLGNAGGSLLFYPYHLAYPSWAFGLLPWAAVLALPFAWRAPAARAALAWLALWFGALQFGMTSLSPPVWFLKELRYLSPIVLPLGLLAAVGFERVWTTRGAPWRIALAVGCAGVLAVGFLRIVETDAGYEQRMEKYRAAAALIRAGRPAGVSFPHFRWAMRVNYFTGYQDGYRAFAPPRPGARFRVADADDRPRPGEWVVDDDRFFGPAYEWRLPHEPVPAWLTEPPARWPARAVAPGVRLVEVPLAP